MLLKVKETRNPQCTRVAGRLPSSPEPSEWITCHVPLVKPGHRKVLGWGGAAVDITPLARMESTLAGVMARQDKRLDADAVKFVQSLQHSLDDYTSALQATMAAVIRRAWQTDMADEHLLAPAVEAMDQRFLEMKELVGSIEDGLAACLPSLN